MKLTDLEKQVLQAIIQSDYLDGDHPVERPVWMIDQYDVSMQPQQLSGAVSSCIKKDYIFVDKDKDGDTVYITQKGYNIALENGCETL